MTIILDGKKLSQKIENELESRIKKLNEKNIKPSLSVILIGNNIESKTYVSMKQKSCNRLGIQNNIISFPDDIKEEEVVQKIKDLNNDSMVHGILVQLPLPKHLDNMRIINTIAEGKDVDGITTINSGRVFQNDNIYFTPCTPEGCIKLLDDYNIEINGKNITIIGSSNLVGLPLSVMLLHRGATVTICNINTRDIKEHINHSDILITCCGVPQLIKKEWIKKGTVIIDIGINKIIDKSKEKGYSLVGDVDFEGVKEKASHITPVPGGIGPMTVAILMEHIIQSCEMSSYVSRI